MTGESGSHIIQAGRVPIAPVYTRWEEGSTNSSAVGGAVELVPPYFAGGDSTPAAVGSGWEVVEGAGAGVTFESWLEPAPTSASVVDAVAPELSGVEPVSTDREIPETETLEVAVVAEGAVEREPVDAAMVPVVELQPMVARVEAQSGAEPEEVLEPESAAAVLGEIVEESAVAIAQGAIEPEQSEEVAQPSSEVIGSSLITGKAVGTVMAPASATAYELAARLEAIAERLRTDGTAAVVAGMRGDRLDALLAGVFAGYLAAREVDS